MAVARPASREQQSVTAEALAVPQRFLRWYQPRMDSLNRICLVPAACNGDTTDAYAVDLAQAERYLAALNVSNLLAPQYLDKRRVYYQQQQREFSQNPPMYDGPPPGFNYDPILYSQDGEEDIAELLKGSPRLVHLAPDSARVSLANPLAERALTFGLLRQKDRWLIQDIRPKFSSQ